MENRKVLETKEVVEKKNILQKELNLKETLIVVGVFVIIMAYVGILILPRYNEYKNSFAQLEQLQQQINTYESDISRLPVLQKELSNLNKEVESAKKKLSYNMEDGMFLIGLSNLINSLDVDLVSYTVDDTITYSNFYAIPTTIEVRGNYNYVRRIMSYLEEQKNTTQILDYSMETYIEEEKEQAEMTTQQTETTSSVVADSVVYWTASGGHYHKQECSELITESNNSGEVVSNGDVTTSGKSYPCEICKPYTLVSTNNQEQTQTVEDTEPKATGDVVARFKFIMYSTENPKYRLDVEDYNNWQPGKYNPFTSTTK